MDTASRTATTAVFNTAEICEMILLQLSPRKLACTQQVNRYLRDVTRGSKPLRRRLCLWRDLHTGIRDGEQYTSLGRLNTAEICEKILLNLEFEDLIRVQQVDHYLQEVIQRSKPLLQKLYFRDDVSRDRGGNPLLERLLQHHGLDTYGLGVHWWLTLPQYGKQINVAVGVGGSPSNMQLPTRFAKMLVHDDYTRFGVFISTANRVKCVHFCDSGCTLGELSEALTRARDILQGRLPMPAPGITYADRPV